METRAPAVAGQFYPLSPEELHTEISGYLSEGERIQVREKAVAVVCPHAGLMFSGAVAGAVYRRIECPDAVVLVGPNHTGMGCMISVFPEGEWMTPFGAVSVDGDLAAAILTRSRYAERDARAHRFEHCLEVQLPFLQYYSREVRIVPITMLQTDLAACEDLGEAMAETIHAAPSPVLLLASTDMSHYESDEEARRKDHEAIEKILHLDPEGLHHTVRRQGISMCGYAPTVAVLFAALRCGAQGAELVAYRTSGEVNGDYSRVVGYAGIVIR